jgi:hypothetical protein
MINIYSLHTWALKETSAIAGSVRYANSLLDRKHVYSMYCLIQDKYLHMCTPKTLDNERLPDTKRA